MTYPTQQTVVYILSPFIAPNNSLVTHIHQLENIYLKVLNYGDLSRLINTQEPYLLLVDARFSEEELFELQTHPILKQSQATALFFAPSKPNLILLSQWYNLAGYFYENLTVQQFGNEIIRMLNGHNCLPKELLIELFKHWQSIHRQQGNQIIQAKLSLTHRELEILSHLQIGQSNLDIADSLFVSEYTIKSHLYRIFRKLNVSNRRQAINWAKLYL